MRLNDLRDVLGANWPAGLDIEITAVTEDSRRVVPGAAFFAVAGEHSDGHDYAAQAVRAGAKVVVGSRPGLKGLCGVPYVYAEHPRTLIGILAHALAGDPSRTMCVVGITGTNGKSSSVLMTRQVLYHCGYHAAAFGTLGYQIGSRHIPARHTTPFAEDLAPLFAQARDAGETHVIMEVSSHALDQERVAGIDFDVGVFTNCTQDHLDYHHDMESYRVAKLKLFERIVGPGRFTVVNGDDPSASLFVEASRVPSYTFGRRGDIRARSVRHEVQGTWFKAETPWGAIEIRLRLVGDHNVANALGVIAVCGGLGVSLDKIGEGIATLQSVPGRFERVNAGQDFHVVVDYAHTEDGLRNVLKASRAICCGRVIAVFGCGGDRDRTKRPKMGAAAAELADFAIVTSDNPRTEDPQRILDDIEPGLVQAGKKRDSDYMVILDRAQAIRRAIGMARSGDLVMIAGKGHEDYQIVGTQRIHFDDREVARMILEGR